MRFILQSHASHPSLIYFRSVGTGAGWPAALGAFMELGLIMELLIDDPGSGAPAALLCEEGQRLVDEIVGLVELERIDVQVTMPDAKELCARLEAAGYQLRDPIDLDAFAVARRRYTSGLSAMAEHLGTPEAPLLRPHAGSGTQRLDKTCASHDP